LNNTIVDNKTGRPLAHYSAIYASLDPQEVSRRCGLAFDAAAQVFSIRILGIEHKALFPSFDLLDMSGHTVTNPYEKILLLRYLCEGKLFPTTGKQLSYNEFPWGSVYHKNFESRCLKRCAAAFGRNIPRFKVLIEHNLPLKAIPLTAGNASYSAAYRFEFINGLYINLILWGADDEFPPQAQILFDDNFVLAFSAEDLAVLGEVLIERLTGLQ
jgi:hypothetical protein